MSSFSYGYGWRPDIEDHAWLARNQVRFDLSPFMSVSIPDEIDPRSSMTVLNQLQQGSCSGASRCALSERLNQIITRTATRIEFSIEYAYLTNQKCCDCFGQDNGATISGSAQAATQYGICHQSLMPSYGTYSTTIPQQATDEAIKHLVQSHSVLHDYQTALQYLGSAGVIQIGIPVGQAFQNCSGPLTVQDAYSDARNPEGGHALAVIGYVKPGTIGAQQGDGRAWLIGQNSWSDRYGAKGFFFIDPKAWDYWSGQVAHGNVELIGMSGFQSFDDPSAAIDWLAVLG